MGTRPTGTLGTTYVIGCMQWLPNMNQHCGWRLTPVDDRFAGGRRPRPVELVSAGTRVVELLMPQSEFGLELEIAL
jgi:hypothetical protein